MKTVPQSFKDLIGNEQYHQLWKEFNKLGKNLIDKPFRLYEEDNLVLLKLFIYLFANDELAKLYGMDNEKGILLIGPLGCGKTTLLKLLSWLIEIEYTFPIVPTTEVAHAYTKDGHHLIKKYTRSSFNDKSQPISYCFDSLGMEGPSSYCTNLCNTMETILRSRYDYFESHGMVTHITTNLSTEEIEDRYGLNLVRTYRMFNVISFAKNSPNKNY